MIWAITYYNKKVYREIADLPIGIAAKYIALTKRMSETGPNIGMPYTRHMGDGLFEIRLKGQEGIARVFYCAMKREEIIMLHSFIKKTQKTPSGELEIAMKRLREVKHYD